MNDVFELLSKLKVDYERINHEAVYTVEEAEKIKDMISGIGCKNLFLKDKDHNYYLYVLNDEKRADLKILKNILQCSRLSFASEEELYEYLKLKKGSVTPLGIINDNAKVIVILDSELKGNKLLLHPNVNTATVSMQYEDLLLIIEYFHNRYIEV